MEWQQWLNDFSLSMTVTPDIESIVLAAILVVGAYAIGWFAAGKVGPWAAKSLSGLIGREEAPAPKPATNIMAFAVTGLLLLIALRATDLGPFGQLLLAAAMGIAAGLLIHQVCEILKLGARLKWAAALILGVIATLAALGGAEPVIQGMNEVGFTLGDTRVTVLSVINVAIVAALLFVVARLAIKILNHSVRRMARLDPSQKLLAEKIGGVAIIVVAVLFGIDLVGIDLTALAVFSGALGLAVGFGLQKTFGNLLAGVILLMDRSVKPGDVIVVGDTFGEVNKIGVRAVSVVTRDGKEHLIPNENLMIEPVENWSYSNRNVRIHVEVGVSYSCDLVLAQKLMIQAAEEADRVLKSPKPSVWLKGYGDSSVDHDILAWIGDPEKGVGNVRSQILNRLWVLFAENDIEIPFPQRDLHIRTAPGLKDAKPIALGNSEQSAQLDHLPSEDAED